MGTTFSVSKFSFLGLLWFAILDVVIQIDVQPNENLNSRAQRGKVPTLNATRTSSH